MGPTDPERDARAPQTDGSDSTPFLAAQLQEAVNEAIARATAAGRKKPKQTYSDAAIAQYVAAYTGKPCGRTYIHDLRKGRRDSPNPYILEALAVYLEKPITYFFSDPNSAAITAQLAVIDAIKGDAAIKTVMLRNYLHELSPEALLAIDNEIRAVRGDAKHDPTAGVEVFRAHPEEET